MLERVDQETKKKFQVMMSGEYIEKLRQYAFGNNMAQGKYIEYLLDNAIKTWEAERLREIYVVMEHISDYLSSKGCRDLDSMVEWLKVNVADILNEGLPEIRAGVDFDQLEKKVFSLFEKSGEGGR